MSPATSPPASTLAPRFADKISFTGLSARIVVNNGTAAVTRSVVLGGTTYTINAPAGPYFRVQVGTTTPVEITVMGQKLAGIFAFEQVTTAARHQGRPDRVQQRQPVPR